MKIDWLFSLNKQYNWCDWFESVASDGRKSNDCIFHVLSSSALFLSLSLPLKIVYSYAVIWNFYAHIYGYAKNYSKPIGQMKPCFPMAAAKNKQGNEVPLHDQIIHNELWLCVFFTYDKLFNSANDE